MLNFVRGRSRDAHSRGVMVLQVRAGACGSSAAMEQQGEIEALRRELERLRAQLEDQHGSSRALEVEARPATRSATPPDRGEARAASPRRSAAGPNASLNGAAGAQASLNGAASGSLDSRRSASPRRSTVLAEYVDHVPVDAKRGKWWLKDRQVLSRKVVAPNAEFMTVKVRELWLWSGRTVIVDKVVTVPTENSIESLNDTRLASPVATFDTHDRLHELGSKTTSESKRNLAVYANSKELAKEFIMQLQGEAGGGGSAPLTASARMEMEMEMEMKRAMETRDKSDGADEARQTSSLRVNDSPR